MNRCETWGARRALLAAGALAFAIGAAAASDHPAFWGERDDANTEQIDHGAWQATLDAYLNADHPSGVNRFDYAALKANAADMGRLADYLASLQALDPRRYSAAEQKAYWINFYNALTVRLVANAYPVKSIRDMGDSWLVAGPWDDVHAKVAGEELTLNNMEHDILRPIWRDNRIHYAVNCASYGCPNLAPPRLYRGQHRRAARGRRQRLRQPPAWRHVAGRRRPFGVQHLRLVPGGFRRDSEETVVEHLLKYAQPELAASLKSFSTVPWTTITTGP